eukprot:4416658-Lingulodinium_polyedra.AAC.1
MLATTWMWFRWSWRSSGCFSHSALGRRCEQAPVARERERAILTAGVYCVLRFGAHIVESPGTRMADVCHHPRGGTIC